MLERVWLAARGAARIDRLLVATDDRRILEAAEGFGAEAVLTSPDHPSGTDRVAEVAASLEAGCRVLVNIQGDEPMLTPTSLDRLVAAFDDDTPPDIATLAEPLTDAGDLFDPNVVKVVTRLDGRALYFSRAPIPYHRGSASELRADFRQALAGRESGWAGYRKHQGIYAYTRQALLDLAALPPSPLERDEGLEQLRALQAGWSIQVVDSDYESLSVDTPNDLERVKKKLLEADR
jgi:3-deoxy-manno-octulosonate cytidylyltransferase (CMP-KDO synthetase)